MSTAVRDTGRAYWKGIAERLRLRADELIDGRFVPATSRGRRATIDPATGSMLAEVAVPFGGFGQSGYGRDLSAQALNQ